MTSKYTYHGNSLITVPTPSVVLYRIPNNDTLYSGTPVEFRCAIEVNGGEAVDTGFTVSSTWSGPSGVLVTGGRFTLSSPVLNGSHYISLLGITPLQSSDTGTYTCTALVSPVPSSSTHVVASTSSFSQSTLGVGKNVSMSKNQIRFQL